MALVRLSRWILLGGTALAAFPARAEVAPGTVEAPPPPATISPSETGANDPVVEKFWEAVQLLGRTKPEDTERGRTLLEEAADAEFSPAQVSLADQLRFGQSGFAQNLRRAAALYRLAAERGDAFGQVGLGQCYLTGHGVPRSRKEARTWLLAAVAPNATYVMPPRPVRAAETQPTADPTGAGIAGALAQDPAARARAHAHYLLGMLFTEEKKPGPAQEHFVAAATAGPGGRDGNHLAAIQAALNYAFGQGVPRDMAKANEMITLARRLVSRAGATLVHLSAERKLVDEFAVGDLEEEVSNEIGHLQTGLQLEVAQTFANPKSPAYNPAEAAKWYEVAAEGDAPWAELSLGLLYAQGKLGAPDPATAFRWFEKAGGDDRPRHLLAAVNLGLCYLHGFGVAADRAKAAEIFSRLRNDDIVAYLGATGRAPDHVVDAAEDLALNETWAKDNEDPHAQFLLGLRYLNGWGVNRDAGEARVWIRRAADQNNGPACSVFGQMLLRERDGNALAAVYFRIGVAANHAPAFEALATMEVLGKTRAESPDEPVRLYEKAIALDPRRVSAYERLIELLTTAPRLLPDAAERVARLLREADRLGSGPAAHRLGMEALANARSDPASARAAYLAFERAAERGQIDARYQLGRMHESGLGVPVTFAEAAHHYRLAALEKHPEATRRLVSLYFTGQGVTRDADRAKFWLQRLANAGDAKALLALGDLATKNRDYEGALQIWNKMLRSYDRATQGYAHDRLAQCYRQGLGVERNDEEALTHRAQAIAFENPDALYWHGQELLGQGRVAEGLNLFAKAAPNCAAASYALGQMFYFGTNVPKDPTIAWRLIRSAADNGSREAQYFLAVTTYQNAPGSPSLDEAIRFAAEAEALGHEKAPKVRQALEKRRGTGDGGPREETTAPRST